MTNTYTAIDLSKLPMPQFVAPLDYDSIYNESLAYLLSLDPTFNAIVESDPAIKVIRALAYRELILRQDINDQAKQCMLAYATGAHLDVAAGNLLIARLDGEDDEAFRERTASAPEGYSVAGPTGAYRFHAMSAHPNIRDVDIWNPKIGGRVNVSVLSKDGDGSTSGARITHPEGYLDGATLIAVTDVLADLQTGMKLTFENGAVFTLDADFPSGSTALTGVLEGTLVEGERAGILPFVMDALSAEDVRPLCDTVRVMSAAIVNYEIIAELTLYYGPDAMVVLQNALENLSAYKESIRRCGHDITRSGIFAALHQPGVQNVHIISPAEDIVINDGEAGFCTDVNVTVPRRDV
ncbi:MAG: baseplate J/gp47 family protein [Kiritimatiellales bacterium]